MITIRIAELNIGIKYRYGFTRSYVEAYGTDAEPDFTVEATDEDLDREAKGHGARGWAQIAKQ